MEIRAPIRPDGSWGVPTLYAGREIPPYEGRMEVEGREEEARAKAKQLVSAMAAERERLAEATEAFRREASSQNRASSSWEGRAPGPASGTPPAIPEDPRGP